MSDDDAVMKAMAIARQWATVPPEHMKIALAALEPSLQRAHEEQMERMRLEHARSWLRAGLTVALAMLAGGVIVGLEGKLWLAGTLMGPSLLALTKVFILKRSDVQDVRAVAQVAQPPPAATGPDAASSNASSL